MKEYAVEVLCREVIAIVNETGDFILSEAAQFDKNTVEVKSRNSLVSYVDKKAEEQLVTALAQLIPESGFIAEEGTSDKKGDVWNWIIDPLDGTTNFIHGIPIFSISIALQKNDELVLGVVKELNQDEVFYAWKGGGAWMNGKPITTGSAETLSESLIATGFPYHDYERLQQYLNLLRDLMHATRGVRRMGSAAVDLAYVACGRFDGFFEYSLNAWDVAAGGFIVQEAGGAVTDFEGGNDWLFGKEILASNAKVKDDFRKKALQFFMN